MARYRTKPATVDAVQNTGEWAPVRNWLVELASGGLAFQPGSAPPITRNDDGALRVDTPCGTERAAVGDWVIRDTEHEFWTFTPDLFAELYEKEG